MFKEIHPEGMRHENHFRSEMYLLCLKMFAALILQGVLSLPSIPPSPFCLSLLEAANKWGCVDVALLGYMCQSDFVTGHIN